MTYLVLARKWRPRSFETLVGQDHVVRALSNALSTQRLHHAWLFTGTRGVGKTTLSRILAKSLNCEQGITAQPCGRCRACTEIDAGRFVDYLELDAASNRGVDEMTQLLEQAVYAPGAGRFKVYMIDEVHMLTGHAFNAMLKTLEEPPPHVKFILATTDPQKIPVTVLSRCLQFNLKQMPADAIVGHLQHVLGEEGIGFEEPALRLIGQAASGSMRDALSLTDQAIAYSSGNLTEESVRGMLGTIDQRHLVRLLNALSAGDAAAVLAVADELAARGLSYSGALADFAVLLSRVAIAQRVPQAVSPSDPLAPEISRLAAALHPDAVQLFYTVAVHSRSELALAPDEYAGFAMACLRMLSLAAESGGRVQAAVSAAAAAAPASSAASAASAVSGASSASSASSASGAPALPGASVPPASSVLPDAPAASSASAPPARMAAGPALAPADGRAPGAAPAQAARPPSRGPAAAGPPDMPEPPDYGPDDFEAAGLEPADYEPPMREPEPAARERAARPTAARAAAPAGRPAAPAMPAASAAPVADAVSRASDAPAAASAAAGPGGELRLDRPWPELATRLPLSGLAAELARQCEWAGAQGHTVTLRVAARTLADSPSRERLRAALSEHFGVAVRLEMQVGATGEATAHAVARADRQARQDAAEAALQADPFVRALVDDFGGRIVPGSVRPLQPPAAPPA